MILLIVEALLIVALCYADYKGCSLCRDYGGHWINLNNGKHCVDDNFKEIDIYK